ncbi:MAG TPA: hypothetical protein EYP29_02175 [Thermoplasmata archaeon]|nr:hypothetical protein [Thermoplasmata archaeon]
MALIKLTRKQRGMIFFTLLVVLLLVMTYIFVIPRVELRVTTVYHQSFSGTSVQTKIENKGTYDIEYMKVNLTALRKEDGKVVASKLELVKLLEPKRAFKIGFTFEGGQMKTYLLILEIDFESKGMDYNKSFEYEIKDYMNNNWEEKIKDWRF